MKILVILLFFATESSAIISADRVDKVSINMYVIGRNFDEDGQKKATLYLQMLMVAE
jgi:hypothetical protein